MKSTFLSFQKANKLVVTVHAIGDKAVRACINNGTVEKRELTRWTTGRYSFEIGGFRVFLDDLK